MAGVANTSPRAESLSPTMVEWRKNCPGVNGKLKHLLQNELLTDVSFRVGGGTDGAALIKAHKLLLAMFSNVFEVMFMGEFIESRRSIVDPIDLPDIQPTAFRTMLKVSQAKNYSRSTVLKDR